MSDQITSLKKAGAFLIMLGITAAVAWGVFELLWILTLIFGSY